MTRCVAVLLCLLALATSAPLPAAGDKPAPDPLVRIDHMPLAVKDVDQAAGTYRRLGFAIKPGRFHDDGIRTQLVKFPDGAGIELITAAAATDALTANYVRLIAQGEGPAYVCFVTQDLVAVRQRLQELGEAYSEEDGQLTLDSPALAWMFIAGGSNRSPTDKPEHFAHPTTAYATLAIWIAGGDQARMLRFFTGLGAHIVRERVYVPDGVLADVAEVASGGKVIFLPADRQLIPGRPIVGIAMQVRDLSAARETEALGGIATVAEHRVPYPRVLVGPRETHGVWLELRGQTLAR
jgi:hypothetical protein